MFAADHALLAGQFIVNIPAAAVGADKVFLDIWNDAAADSQPLVLRSLCAIKDGSAAVTGVLGVKLYATRTTAIGTGGTAATTEGATLANPSIVATNPLQARVPVGVTARAAPAGGATGGAIIGSANVFSEETSAGSYDPVELLPAPIMIPGKSGVRVIQGSVASVGNIGFAAVLGAY